MLRSGTRDLSPACSLFRRLAPLLALTAGLATVPPALAAKSLPWPWAPDTTASATRPRAGGLRPMDVPDISGFGKVLWVILLIVLPYIGIFAYILTQGRGMAERNRSQARQARDELRQMVGFSAADELMKLDRLVSEKSISKEEYARLRARILE